MVDLLISATMIIAAGAASLAALALARATGLDKALGRWARSDTTSEVLIGRMVDLAVVLHTRNSHSPDAGSIRSLALSVLEEVGTSRGGTRRALIIVGGVALIAVSIAALSGGFLPSLPYQTASVAFPSALLGLSMIAWAVASTVTAEAREMQELTLAEMVAAAVILATPGDRREQIEAKMEALAEEGGCRARSAA